MRRSPCVGLPCHAIDSGRTVTREREIAPLEEVGGDVMQQGREPYSLALPRRSAHGASPFDAKITKHYRGKLQTEIKDMSLPNPVIRSGASCSITSART
jgi:hypothetical protein